MSNVLFTEVTPSRSVQDSNFSRGVIDFLYGCSGSTAHIIKDSYFRFQVTVTGRGGAEAPHFSEQIALAENFVGNLFTNVFFKVGGVDVSVCVNNHPQISALLSRVNPTWSNNKTIGPSCMAWNGSFAERCATISTGAISNVTAQNRNGELYSGTTKLSGMDDCREESFKLFPTATITATTGTEYVLQATGANSLITLNYLTATGVVGTVPIPGGVPLTETSYFTAADIGNTIVINGYSAVITNVYSTNVPTPVTNGSSQGTFITTQPDLSTATTLTVPLANGTAGDAFTRNWYVIRRNLLRSDQGKNIIDVIYRPALGIFEFGEPIGAAQFHIQLNPDPSYAYRAIETQNNAYQLANIATNTTRPYDITINDMRYYACMKQVPIIDSVSMLHLREWTAMSNTMTQLTSNFNWSVPASTELVYVFVQTGNPTPAIPPNKFVGEQGFDLNLQYLQCTYGSVTLPPQRLDSAYVFSPTTLNAGALPLSNQSRLQQYYYWNQLQLGKAFSDAETYNQWLTRGPYYAFLWEKPADSRDTDLQLYISYSGTSPITGAAYSTLPQPLQVFLVSEYRRVTEITHQNGAVVAVRALNV